MLAGRPPFTGSTAIEILQKHRFGQFDLPGRYATDVPTWLDDVVRQLLEKDPDKRLPDAYVVQRRLQEVINRVDLRSASEVTLIAPEGPPPEGSTVPATDSLERALPGQATLMRNLVRDEIRRGEPAAWWQKLLNNTFVLVGLLVALIAIVWWVESRRVTPEQHLAIAQALLDGPPGSDWLKARDEHLKPLLEADPARWGPTVEPLLEEIEAYELEQRLISPRRRGRKSAPQTEAERLLADVRRLWDAGQFAEAQRRLAATQRLLASDPESAALSRLAARWRGELAEAVAEQPSPADYVRGVLSRTAALERSDSETARGLWTAIVELYADDPRVAAEVAEARRRLSESRD
jgi:serine/threonine-protein kinase